METTADSPGQGRCGGVCKASTQGSQVGSLGYVTTEQDPDSDRQTLSTALEGKTNPVVSVASGKARDTSPETSEMASADARAGI